MESEYVELLPRVCAVLGDSRQSVVDDTCLEKLLDCFQAITKNETELYILQRIPCLTHIIVNIPKQRDLNPSTLSFIMRLTGLFAASENYFHELENDGILSSMFGSPASLGSETWEEATVRCGWLLGIQNMLQHEAVIQFLCKYDCIDEIIRLQKDPSIFVASTASHLLANILSFSLQCSELAFLGNGSKIQLNDTVAALHSVDWSDCVYAITGHIEDFLKSGVTSNIQQALKLLSMVSGTNYPVAIVSLWPKIEESIKLLLKGDLTGLGQPLTKLFLNVSRTVPCDVLEPKIWDLLSLLLRLLNQAEALTLASGILKLKSCPKSLRMQAATALFQPLNYIGTVTSVQPQEDTVLLDASSNYRVDIEHRVSRKSACVNLLCQTLLHLLELLQMPSQRIELPYQALIHSVLTVLKLCIGTAIPTTSAGVSISRHLIGCIKVQRAGIDVLGAIPQWAGRIEEVNSALNLLLDYIRNPDTDSTVLKKTLQALFHWMLHCIEAVDSPALEPTLKEFLDGDFLSVMKKRLFDVHWEIRDSALEFLGQLCFQFKEVESFCRSIGSCGIPHLVLELLSDPESYVRASAISALGKMNYLSPNWQTLPNENSVTVMKGNILPHLLDILNQDTEGFPRRAAVKVLADWLKNSHMLSSCELDNFVPIILKIGSNDLDWEVKVHSLELAEAFIDQSSSNSLISPYAVVLSNSTHSAQVKVLLQTLCDAGIFTILFHALWDCDRPVAQKACEILMKLKRIAPGADSSQIHNKLNGHKPNRESFADWLSSSNFNLQNVSNVMEVMIALDLEFQHQQLVRSSDHIESSLRSLLQDILAAAENSEDSGADCY
ncbi:BRCA1-associated ATM activator 1 isoform X1 [Scyliorhinus canicula]|uniref:BRCA1-associated ATM activator 1 isoform X1 n=2 Tax=Scyliorhinus canicula TaxID=7830 RepID=UPI0018F2B17D|nr:BRCA1-associated ATM activator 1 isoform X1 [Scyliorhinus canicula]XP_038675675.1 BRCA1-associated ATM activator 1 isoform X1 [Scyliorhinus canicula]XP_038675676.1 BRCA1-associated ATM activator 1 isoform X1 [Scyliorhinus canicula]XP_038675677.1 BRCA1-associated ATM activator 1 isoform X1 [Scyliorhinus canicula]